MPALSNRKWEAFAQRLAEGEPAYKAYESAGYASNHGNASTLNKNQKVQNRVAEILAEREQAEREATKKAINAIGVTKEQVIEELRRIGFADIRKAVKWGPTQRISEMIDGSIVMSNGVTLIDSSDIDDATAAAISEVGNTKEGIKIKFHDKKGALIELLRLLNVSAPPKAEDEPQPGADLPAGSNVVHFDAALKRFG
ncbi:terminase small subunit [Aminobacter anthyllidis]|uniref:Terminase small subunit n=1 Tax=Aminobacter anthyllidis TaxID=1035067 RepID=A0A9X1A788_9HYPH|nr:terminase small subunit [Aminobacter anthyllidis]MBT1154355.1 terminase small subunit [Aminobacter anthyllidis]